MTIEILTGDMFASGADSLVCPVNCVGVMGAGLAKVFLKRYPDASKSYQRSCSRGSISPGEAVPILSPSGERLPGRVCPLIYFTATKLHWRNPSEIRWIHLAAASLIWRAVGNAVTHQSIAICALGVGCGGLDWDDVRPILVRAAEVIEAAGVKVFLYGPK